MEQVTQEDREALIRMLRVDDPWCNDKCNDAADQIEVDAAALAQARAETEALRKELAARVEDELERTALMNLEASTEWIDGFEHAWKRARAALDGRAG